MRWALLVLVGCGARTTLSEDHVVVDASVDASVIVDPDAPKPVTDSGACFLIQDVRVCGATCKAFDCCAPLYDARGAPVDVGVCWIDRGDDGRTSCRASCEACVWREPGRAVCVTRYMCEQLAKLGAGAACDAK